jgi:hypothetical protein
VRPTLRGEVFQPELLPKASDTVRVGTGVGRGVIAESAVSRANVRGSGRGQGVACVGGRRSTVAGSVRLGGLLAKLQRPWAWWVWMCGTNGCCPLTSHGTEAARGLACIH